MTAILRHGREGFLKVALAAALDAAALPAQADELLVGVLRDQDGTVVAGANVTAVDANGGVLSRDRSAADGTFALAAPSRPAAVAGHRRRRRSAADRGAGRATRRSPGSSAGTARPT